MSETWVIKDNAPVDEASYDIPDVSCSFSSNGKAFSGMHTYTDQVYLWVYYDYSASKSEEVAIIDVIAMGAFEWQNEAYKTLVFDTAPTGELLAWLQKNADKQDKAYLAKESELKDIADAIRSVGGTTEQLVFPDGFVTAIGTLYIITLSQSEYAAASAAGTLDEGKWYGVYPDA